MASEGSLKGKRPGLVGFAIDLRLDVLDLPDLGRVVCAARCQLLDVGREENSRNVLFVSAEMRYWEQLRLVIVLAEMPHKHIALAEVS